MSGIDDYEVVRELGRGSSSVVELAWQSSLARTVAMKRLLRVWRGDEAAAARLRREAQVISRLVDRRVVTLFDVVVDGSDVVLVMEHVPGPTVRALCAQARPTPAQALAVVADVGGALGCAARAGVVHRDVKPANVFVTAEGRCKLGDFGLARISADDQLFRSQDGVRRGTPLYMAPEQLVGAELTPACDVYALAVLAWELLAGHHPLEAMTVPQMVSAHLDGALQRAELPCVPPAVTGVLRTALTPDPARRPPAEELAATLAHHAPADWLQGAGAVPGAVPVRGDEGLWRWDTGWTKDQVAASTWVGAAEPSPSRTGPQTTEPDDLPSIDGSWLTERALSPVSRGAGTTVTARQRQHWALVACSFALGFVAVLLALLWFH